MSNYSTILVPHDGSEMSDMAFDEAAKLAGIFDSLIILLYVVDERFAPPSALLAFIRDKTSLKAAKNALKKVLSKGGEAMLQDRISKLKDKGIKARMEFKVGSPAKEIVQASQDARCDIIIMGSKSLRFGSKFKALGSVARKVAEEATCPVMLVH
jgi:nucleotide-binding universal stress UspA family protein